jgi:Spy/CpxP family protein refolding chaperone
MKTLFSLIFIGCFLSSGALMAAAQDTTRQSNQPASTAQGRDYTATLKEVFAPISDQLSLTKEQEFRIIAIITEAEVKLEPLGQELNDVGLQLVDAAMNDTPDEATISLLAAREAQLLTQMISMKVRANAGIYQVLTPNQRTLVSRQFRGTNPLSSGLGAVSIH